MRMKSVISVFLLVSVAVLFGSCGKDPVEYEDTSGSLKPEGYSIDEGTLTKPESDESFAAGELESLDQTGVNPLEMNPNSKEFWDVYGRSTPPLYPVYFDFDSSAINVEQLPNLNKNSSYLLENPSVELIIEGNCDERGTADYNLALGELRAISVKKYLTNMGVKTERLTTISYGFHRPLYPGSNEEAWSKNRRADLVTK